MFKLGDVVSNKDSINFISVGSGVSFEGEIIEINNRIENLNIRVNVTKSNVDKYIGRTFWFDESEIMKVVECESIPVKNILKDCMIVELRSGTRYLKLKNNIIFSYHSISLGNYNDDLTFPDNSNLDIVVIYEPIRIKSFNTIFNSNNLSLIWRRDKEIDWSKVDEFVKVLVRDHDDQQWKKKYFKKYWEDKKFPFETYSRLEDDFTGEKPVVSSAYKQIKFHESVEIKEEWYKK